MIDIPVSETPAMDFSGAGALPTPAPPSPAPQTRAAPPQTSGVPLKKGEKLSISKPDAPLDSLTVGLGWDAPGGNPPYDLDAEVFLLGDNDKVVGDSWFVYYNQTASPDGAVLHEGDSRDGAGSGDDETIRVRLSRLSPQVKKLAFVVTINEARARGQSFGAVKNAYIRILDGASGRELARFNLTDYYSNVYSMVAGELYLRNGEWKFNPVGDGTADDLASLCQRYGVNVSD